MSGEIPNLVAVTTARVGEQVQLQISSLEAGAIVDVTMDQGMALMVAKKLMNALANMPEIPEDQQC